VFLPLLAPLPDLPRLVAAGLHGVAAEGRALTAASKEAVKARSGAIYAHFGIEPVRKHILCPLPDHDDRNPSFRLDDQGGWICTCGAGDVISLTSRMRGLKFTEALTLCAEIAGTEPPEPVRQTMPSTTGKYAQEIWQRATRSDNAVSTHHYAMEKQITHAFGAGRALVTGKLIGQGADCIVVPIRHQGTGEVVSVQCINEDGVKQTFGQMGAAFLLLGDEHDQKAGWFVVEGWATAWGIRKLVHRSAALVSFGLSRMEPVAILAADLYQPKKVRVLKDAP